MTGTQTVHSGWIEALAAPRPEPARDGAAPGQRTCAGSSRRRPRSPTTEGCGRGGSRSSPTPAGISWVTALVAGLHELRGHDLPEAMVEKMRRKAFAAPCTVAVIASPDPGSNVPVWEQVASASCTGYALVLGATALGFGAVWKSAAVLETSPVRSLFDLGEDEDLLGWVNMGTPIPAGERRASVATPNRWTSSSW